MDPILFLPETTILWLAIALKIERFENQRWTRARIGGLRGSSEGFGFFVDFTGLLAWIAKFAFYAAHWYDFGWQKTLGFVLLPALGVLIYGFLSSLAYRDKLLVWMACTILIYPTLIGLAARFTWFGLRH